MRDEVIRGLRLLLGLLIVLAAAPPALAQPCPDCLGAGAARVALRLPAGVPLAGYGSLARRLLIPDVFDRYPHAFWFKPSDGQRDPLAARALVLESGGTRVAWVAVDLLAVDAAFTAEVERRLAAAGAPMSAVLISASHTHSGPGAFVESSVFGWLALDRLARDVRESLLEDVVAVVRQADAARRPSRIAAGRVTAPPVVLSRMRQPLDAEMLVLRVTGAGGAPVALVWNYAIHGTMLGASNLKLSGDVMGDASTALERALGIPVLFVNGAVGDVSPRHHGDRAAQAIGAELAAAIHHGWSEAVPIGRPELSVAARDVTLPSARGSVKNCLRGWAPAAFTVPLGSTLPRETRLTAVRIGDTAVVTAPGEFQTKLGLAIKQAGRAHFARTLVAGVSNDYLGYFVTAADYDRPSYVTCATVYGPRTGDCLAAGAGRLLARLARGEQAPAAKLACDRG